MYSFVFLSGLLPRFYLIRLPWVHTPHEMKGVFQVPRDRGHKMDVADPDVEERRRRWRPNGYWELVEGENEDRILDELELGSIAPQRRNFRFLTSRKRASARAGTLDYSSAVDDAGPRR